MHASESTYFRNLERDIGMLRSHGFDTWPSGDELALYAFDLADGMDELARAVGVSLEKDLRGRWRTRPVKGGADSHGRA